MLLITDSGDPDRAGRWHCRTVVRLGDVSAPRTRATAIVCDVALDDLASVQAVRDALARHRTSPAIPVHFVLRHEDIFAHAMANALGATTISIDDPPLAHDRARITAGAATSLIERAEARPSVEGDIASVSAIVSRIFGAAVARTPLAGQDLDDGVAALLRSTKEAGIGRWVEIVRRYDDATYQHCLLVAGLTAAFAAQLGLTLARQRMLVKAALLHDIGKARVPRPILNKEGPLTTAETTQMRRHPADGYFMLARQNGLEPGVLDVVLHHHEMLDGSGYPDGLSRNQIADSVRIVTICDIHAALIERRAYRPPMPSDAAYEILVSMGSKLDTNLVAAFRGVVDAMRADADILLSATA